MGILDEAIREHLELKRQHGADDSELKQLEDDAFGSPGRPGSEDSSDPAAEAATEFMSQPDLDEAPEGDSGERPSAEADEAPSRREPPAGLVDLQEAPPADDRADEEPESEAPAEEEQPAGEHEAIAEPIAGGPNTEERHAIADQPTEMFDVEEQFASDEDVAPTEKPAPPDEDLVAEEIAEPRLAPSEPIHDLEPATPADGPSDEDEEEDDFFSEQRLSDELDQALEAPLEDEPESAEHEVVEEPERTDEHEVVDPDRTQVHEVVAEADKSDEEKERDALEKTPDFLEEAPEDDQLWFEQKPPKDFDFDD